jgi:hypothetical protein
MVRGVQELIERSAVLNVIVNCSYGMLASCPLHRIMSAHNGYLLDISDAWC